MEKEIADLLDSYYKPDNIEELLKEPQVSHHLLSRIVTFCGVSVIEEFKFYKPEDYYIRILDYLNKTVDKLECMEVPKDCQLSYKLATSFIKLVNAHYSIMYDENGLAQKAKSRSDWDSTTGFLYNSWTFYEDKIEEMETCIFLKLKEISKNNKVDINEIKQQARDMISSFKEHTYWKTIEDSDKLREYDRALEEFYDSLM